MLVPEARQALERLTQISQGLDENKVRLSTDELNDLREVGGLLNGARTDCEATLDALDELGRGESDYSNPIADLAMRLLKDEGGARLREVKETVDAAIRVLSKYDE